MSKKIEKHHIDSQFDDLWIKLKQVLGQHNSKLIIIHVEGERLTSKRVKLAIFNNNTLKFISKASSGNCEFEYDFAHKKMTLITPANSQPVDPILSVSDLLALVDKGKATLLKS